MAKRAEKSLDPKSLPVQSRSRETVIRILETARQVLIAEGLDAFTTTRIAQQSGVNIASIYRYFPHKEAIIAELYRGWLADIRALYDEYQAAHAHLTDGAAYICGLFDELLDRPSAAQNKLTVVLLHAIALNPAMSQIGDAHLALVHDRLCADAARFGMIEKSSAPPLWIKFLMQTASDILLRAAMAPKAEAEKIRQMSRMTIRILAQYKPWGEQELPEGFEIWH